MSTYKARFLPAAEADRLFAWLQTDVHWRTETVSLFGKRQLVPRMVSWFGEPGLDYRYAGRSHPGIGWPDELAALRSSVAAELRSEPNFLLLNRYRDGSDSMGWHKDNEQGLDTKIASVTLGATRTFLIREANSARSRSLKLEHGSLLMFDGVTPHALPKTRRLVGERINLTFRVLH